LYRISFLQASVSITDDGGVVNKNIWAVIAPDEAVPFGVVKPLHGSVHCDCPPEDAGDSRTIEEHAEGAADCETRGVYQNQTLSQVFEKMALPAIMYKYSLSKIDLSRLLPRGPFAPLCRQKTQKVQQARNRFGVAQLPSSHHRFDLRRRERLCSDFFVVL